MPTVQYRKSVPAVARPDVLVCGTGQRGIGATVAAARNGTSIVEGLPFDQIKGDADDSW